MIDNYKFVGGKGYFTLTHQGEKVANFHLPMIGRHNIENATSVAAMSLKLGLTTQEIQERISDLQGDQTKTGSIGS